MLSSGSPKTTRDFYADVGFGLVPGYTRFAALGVNPDVDSGTLPEDIWPGGGVYPWMASALPLQLNSTSASDTAAGVGARTVTVTGLDINYVLLIEVVTLNGLTQVPLVGAFFRINSMVVSTAGSSEGNVGTLSLTRVTGGNLQSQIQAGDSISRQAIFTVPAGSTTQILSMFFSANKQAAIPVLTMQTWTRTASGVARKPLEVGIYSTPYRHDGVPGVILPEKMDFSLRCTFSSLDNVALTAAILGITRDTSFA